MNAPEATQGLTCPRCGGAVPIPEGQPIVICPYCDLRSFIPGEHGVRRYQTPCLVSREDALRAFQKFIASKWAIARDCARLAQVSEVFQIALPFWAAWGRGLGWTFGQVQVGSGKNKRYEARERRVVEELTWNEAACDVAEFGVTQVSLEGRRLDPFNPQELHRTAMVFEPLGSAQEALAKARSAFEERVKKLARMERINQSFSWIVRPRQAIVYYPLWVIRYQYQGRSFQVVVDGSSGEVLYGKAPGNAFYRALVLVAGMMAGAFIALDLSALLLSSDSDNSLVGALVVFVVGLGIMAYAYRAFRYGEHYEYRKKGGPLPDFLSALPVDDSIVQVQKVLGQLEKFQ